MNVHYAFVLASFAIATSACVAGTSTDEQTSTARSADSAFVPEAGVYDVSRSVGHTTNPEYCGLAAPPMTVSNVSATGYDITFSAGPFTFVQPMVLGNGHSALPANGPRTEASSLDLSEYGLDAILYFHTATGTQWTATDRFNVHDVFSQRCSGPDCTKLDKCAANAQRTYVRQ